MLVLHEFFSAALASELAVRAAYAWRGTRSEMLAAPFGCFLKSTTARGNLGCSERGDFVLSQPDLKPIEAVRRLPSVPGALKPTVSVYPCPHSTLRCTCK